MKGDKEPLMETLRKVKAEVIHLTEGEASQGKLNLLRQLGANKTVAIGNGVDDISMIEEAGLGICVISKEGTAGEMIQKADVLVSNILDALDFLLKPLRHRATLSL
jgi:soluble P-type ATPase